MRILSTALLAAGLAFAGPAFSHDYTAGSLQIDHPWTRATPPSANVGGGYLVIHNDGPDDDRLIGGHSPVAETVEVHEMSIVDDVMRMRELADGLALPAGESVALEPGGLHLMLIGLDEPFTTGERVPLTLTFEKAGDVEVELAVEAAGVGGQESHGGHGGH